MSGNYYQGDTNPFGERLSQKNGYGLSKDIECQLQELLFDAYQSGNNAIALTCLRLVRELICCVKAEESVVSQEKDWRTNAKYRFFYFHNLPLLRARLEQQDYCRACNELGDLILWGQCLRRAEVRDIVLELLVLDKNLSQGMVFNV